MSLLVPPVPRATFRDSEHQAQFERRGYVIVPLLGAAEVRRLSELYERLDAGLRDGFYSSLWSGSIEYRDEVNREVTTTLFPATDRVLADYRFCLGNFAVKLPVRDSVVPVHQDWSFVDERQFASVTVWCPLIDTDETTGCLEVLPGSQRFCRNIRPNGEGDSACSPFAPLVPEIVERHLLALPVPAGTGIIYNARLVHYSRSNQGACPRVAAVGASIPREASLMHYYRRSPAEVEAFRVEDDFYWRSVRLAERPVNQQSIGFEPTPTLPFTHETLAAAIAAHRADETDHAARATQAGSASR